MYPNGTHGALEGHNIPQTSHRQTSKCEIHRELCVFAADVFNAYACACVLSPGAIRMVRVKSRLVCGVSAANMPRFLLNISQLGRRIKARTHACGRSMGMGSC